MEEIRRTGWAVSFGEREEGLAAAAVPIRNRAGMVDATLTISGPTARLTEERLLAHRLELSAAADEISRARGWNERVIDGPPIAASAGMSDLSPASGAR
jgi:DNA-binding IclR family transcriptional regulator